SYHYLPPDKPKAARESRNAAAARVAAHLLSFYDAGERGNVAATAALMAEYRARSFVIGKTVTVNPAAGLRGEPYQATVLDISDDAGLVVRCADGTEKTLQSGEVSLHGTDFAQ
ncbi:MAG: hypothetical protein K2O09_00250, partial [Treponemataceae bacterium]|nr:hypothetical protein [Treponemataceae bacterium]